MKVFIATLILCSALPVTSQTPGTRVADLVGGKYIGGNKIADEPPTGYERFLMLWVDDPGICRPEVQVNVRENFLPDSSGRIRICGRVVFQGKNFPKGGSVADGNYLIYEFKEGYLIDLKEKPIRLEFVTKTVDGVCYRFSGTYIEHANTTIDLIGNMGRFVNESRASETTLAFSRVLMIE